MHQFTIYYATWNRTTRTMSGRLMTTVTAKSPWGALRTWWRIQRQYQTLAEVHDLRPCHTRACQVDYPTHWAYECAHA